MASINVNRPTGGLPPDPRRPRRPMLPVRLPGNTGTATPAPGTLVDTGHGDSGAPFPNDKPITAVDNQRVVDPTQFQAFQSQSGNLASAGVVLLLAEPTSTRCYLNIRVTADSKGSLAVSVNQNPQSADQASWVINPGDEKEFLFRVPQNRLYALADNGAVSYVVTSAQIAQLGG